MTIMMDGSGNCIEVEGGVVAIGSGGLYAHSAAVGMLDDDRLTAENICHRAMKIAGDLCIYTNHNTVIRSMPAAEAEIPKEETKKPFTPTVAYWDERAKGA